jgi:hypothetical protein
METPIKINYQRPLMTIQDMINFIEKGEKFLKLDSSFLSDEDEIQYLQAIILSPDYQREYRSKPKEESSIIESIILNIPIPEIFLVKSNHNGIQLRHVMDGQHRLTAIYRYVRDMYVLSDLEILRDNPRYVGRKFSSLEKEDKIKILTSTLSVLEFDPTGDEVEIELFKRYNRNTKPLEKHEIAMATYYSETSRYITRFINLSFENRHDDVYSALNCKVYNITVDRNKKQKNHQEICIILSILCNGPILKYKDGVEISEKFLEEQAKISKENRRENIERISDEFLLFNNFIYRLADEVDFPFSTEIFRGYEKRNTKFNTGVSIILALIKYYFEIDLSSKDIMDEVRYIIEHSPIGDFFYNASSTNMRTIMTYLIHHEVFEKKYKSLTLKTTVNDSIKNEIDKVLNRRSTSGESVKERLERTTILDRYVWDEE